MEHLNSAGWYFPKTDNRRFHKLKKKKSCNLHTCGHPGAQFQNFKTNTSLKVRIKTQVSCLGETLTSYRQQPSDTYQVETTGDNVKEEQVNVQVTEYKALNYFQELCHVMGEAGPIMHQCWICSTSCASKPTASCFVSSPN